MLGRHRGVELGARHEILLRELLGTLPRQHGVIELGLGLADDGGLLDGHTIVRAVGHQSESRARLVQRRLRLIDAQIEIDGVEPGDDLAAMDARTEIHGQVGETAGDLQAQHDLLFRVERPVHRHRADHLEFLGGHDTHIARLDGRRGTLLRRGGRGVIGAAARRGENDEGDEQTARAGEGHRRHILTQIPLELNPPPG